MSGFEYAMVLVSIIIGLGVTHILTSLGSAVHRLRGHGKPLRLELAMGLVLVVWSNFLTFYEQFVLGHW